MTLQNIISQSKVVPVVTIHDPNDAIPMSKALLAGGIKAIEITLRTPQAFDAIHAVRKSDLDIAVGVGTVINTEQVKTCSELGVDFLVTPGTTDSLIHAIKAAKLPVIPGISTCGEAVAMLEHGYEFVKFFPAEASGGIATLKAIGGPLPQLTFMPTGGISQDMVRSYLEVSSVVGVGGSWVCDKVSVSKKDWAQIAKNAQVAQTL